MRAEAQRNEVVISTIPSQDRQPQPLPTHCTHGVLNLSGHYYVPGSASSQLVTESLLRLSRGVLAISTVQTDFAEICMLPGA